MKETAQHPLQIKNAVQHTAQQLEKYSNSARLDSELLVSLVIQQPRTYLYSHSTDIISTDQQQQLQQFIQRRQAGEPMAYLIGYQEFWSLKFKVAPATLIPRPETEHMVEWILNHFAKETHLQLADLGTGSGAIAIAIASERPEWQIDATDQSLAALAIARFNAENLQQTVNFYHGDWCAALPHKNYDIIVSNPPYIAEDDPHLLDLQNEPRDALVACKQGLAAIEKIAMEAIHYLRPDGYLVMEHGYEQSEIVKIILEQIGFKKEFIEFHTDLARLPRFVVARKYERK